MNPNANLQQQEQILEAMARLDDSDPDEFTNITRAALHNELIAFREALEVWLSNRGFEPDWSKAPNAARYYSRPR